MHQLKILLLKDLLILKNNILLALRKPWRWLFAVGFFGMLIYNRIALSTESADFTSSDAELPELSEAGIEKVQTIFAAFVGILSLLVVVFVISRATKRNTTFFINADTHFLFSGPFSPRLLILYQLFKSLLPALISSFVFIIYFFLVIRPENFSVSHSQLGQIVAMLGLFIFSIKPVQFLIFSVVSGGAANQAVQRVLVIRNFLILAALVAIGIHFPAEGTLSLLKHTFLNGTFQYVPFVGWFQAAIVGVLTGRDVWWALVLFVITVVALPLAVYRLAHQYYEDVLASTELQTRAEQIRSGETQMNDEIEFSWALNTKNIRDHRDFGRGAVALFWKNWVMSFRQTGIPLIDPTTIFSAIFGILIGIGIYVGKVGIEDFSGLLILSFSLLGLLSFSAGYMRVRIGDLTRPQFALIPDTVGRKLRYFLLLDLLQVSAYTLFFYGPLVLAFGGYFDIIPFSMVAMVAVYLTGFLFQLNVRLAVSSFIDRYLFLPLGYLALLMFCLMPSIFISIAAYGYFQSYGAAFFAMAMVWAVWAALLYIFVTERIDRLEY